jgi:hypothetical protein
VCRGEGGVGRVAVSFAIEVSAGLESYAIAGPVCIMVWCVVWVRMVEKSRIEIRV